MTILDIRTFPDPVLREKTQVVTDFGDSLKKLLDDMFETMRHAHGIGLAAPQVGVLQQVAVIDISEDQNERIDLVNPQIVEGNGKVSSEEGCLSIPEYRDSIKRRSEVVVRAQDSQGNPFELHADGLLAICLQHEIDHLNGVLFIDHLSRLKRELFRRWFKRQQASEE